MANPLLPRRGRFPTRRSRAHFHASPIRVWETDRGARRRANWPRLPNLSEGRPAGSCPIEEPEMAVLPRRPLAKREFRFFDALRRTDGRAARSSRGDAGCHATISAMNRGQLQRPPTTLRQDRRPVESTGRPPGRHRRETAPISARNRFSCPASNSGLLNRRPQSRARSSVVNQPGSSSNVWASGTPAASVESSNSRCTASRDDAGTWSRRTRRREEEPRLPAQLGDDESVARPSIKRPFAMRVNRIVAWAVRTLNGRHEGRSVKLGRQRGCKLAPTRAPRPPHRGESSNRASVSSG